MRQMRLGNRLTIVLAIACLAAGGLIAIQRQPEGSPASGSSLASEATIEPAPAETGTAILPLVYDPPSLAVYDAILERPLFVPGRRGAEPAETPVAEAAQPPAATLALRLEGVAIAPGDRPSDRVAVLRRTTTQEVLRLTPGEAVDGWKLAEVRADRVVLRAGERTQELLLELAGGGGRPAVGPRPPPRPPPRPSR